MKEFFGAQNETVLLREPELNAEERDVREDLLIQHWTSSVRVEISFRNLICKKSEFSYSTAVMDHMEGWNAQDIETEDAAKSLKKSTCRKLLACCWTYGKAVICSELSFLMHEHDVCPTPNYILTCRVLHKWALTLRMLLRNRLSKFRCQRPWLQDVFC